MKRSRALTVGLVLAAATFAWLAHRAPLAQGYDARTFAGAMRWRPIGPFRGGRTKAITGVPGDQNPKRERIQQHPSFALRVLAACSRPAPQAGRTESPL